MISIKDRKEGACFLCREMFHENRACYAISVYSTLHQQHSFWFHRECWKNIAGEE